MPEPTVEHTALARHSRHWSRLLVVGLLLLAVASGGAAGLVATAFGAALAGRALWNATGEQAQLVLVAGPLLALAPMAALLWAALHHPLLARWMGLTLAVWVGVAAATLWLGLRALVR
jgi:hypothetical protein